MRPLATIATTRSRANTNFVMFPERSGGANGSPTPSPLAWRAPDVTLVTKYIGNMKEITRTQTGLRLESRLLKVLKALATELDISLGDLLEGIVLHAFEGKAPFSPATLKKIKALKAVYELDLKAADSHHLKEEGGNA